MNKFTLMILCGLREQKQTEWCSRTQFNGLKFLQDSSKKIIHLFNAHMPRLSQIARSTVSRMQICFAWKSIWSCSKESRTALLLSPLTPAHAGLPLAVYLLSCGKCFHQLHTHGHASQRQRLTSDSLNHHGPICRSHRPTLAALSASKTRSPCKCLLGRIKHAILGHRGNNYPLWEEATDCPSGEGFKSFSAEQVECEAPEYNLAEKNNHEMRKFQVFIT